MANPPPPRMPAPPPKPVPRWRVACGKAVPYLAGALMAATFMQMALGGLFAIGSDPEVGQRAIDAHMVLVHVIEFGVYALILVGFLGRDPWAGAMGVVLFVLIGAQYALIRDDTWMRGLHVANGVLVFAVALGLLMRRLPAPKASPPSA